MNDTVQNKNDSVPQWVFYLVAVLVGGGSVTGVGLVGGGEIKMQVVSQALAEGYVQKDQFHRVTDKLENALSENHDLMIDISAQLQTSNDNAERFQRTLENIEARLRAEEQKSAASAQHRNRMEDQMTDAMNAIVGLAESRNDGD